MNLGDLGGLVLRLYRLYHRYQHYLDDLGGLGDLGDLGGLVLRRYRRFLSPLLLQYYLGGLGGLVLRNDLERPVFAKFLFLADLKMWLLEQAEVRAALMSGSGATVFAVLDEAGEIESLAERARTELDPNLWWWGGSVNPGSP